MSMVNLQKLLSIGRVQQRTARPVLQYYHFLALNGQQMGIGVGGSHPKKLFFAAMNGKCGMDGLFRPMRMNKRDRMQEFVRTLHTGGAQCMHAFEGRFGGSTDFESTAGGLRVSCDVDPAAFGEDKR